MKNPLAIALTALVLSLVALGNAMIGSSSPMASQTSDVGPATSPTETELVARIYDLESEMKELGAELEQLAMTLSVREPGASRVPVTTNVLEEEELENLVEKVRESLQAQPPGWEALPTDFTEQVASTMQAVKREQANLKADARLVSRSEKLTSRMPDAVESLGLSSSQEIELFGAISNWYAAEAQMSLMWAEGSPVEELGTFKAESYGAFESSLDEILSPQQLTDYQALDGAIFPGADWGEK